MSGSPYSDFSKPVDEEAQKKWALYILLFCIAASLLIGFVSNRNQADSEPVVFDEGARDFIDGLMDDISPGRMNAKEERVYRIWWMITEVNNGGFQQYFFNSTGDSALETVEHLESIGAKETANLVQIGCELFPNKQPSKDYIQRRAQLNEFTRLQLETLKQLDEHFFSRKEDLFKLLKEDWESQQTKGKSGQ